MNPLEPQPLEDPPIEVPSESFARQLKEARREAKLTQVQLAERVKGLGGSLHATAITRIEKGERAVTLDEVMVLAKALGVSPKNLIVPIREDVRVRITPSDKVVVAPFRAREWFQGELPLIYPGELGTQAEPPRRDFDRDRFFYTWAPATDRVLDQNPAYWACMQLLIGLRNEIVLDALPEVPATAHRPTKLETLPPDVEHRSQRLQRLRRLERHLQNAAEEITDYIETLRDSSNRRRSEPPSPAE